MVVASGRTVARAIARIRFVGELRIREPTKKRRLQP